MSDSLISKNAIIGGNFNIGRFSIIEDDVVIGDNVRIDSNVLIAAGSRISDNVIIHHGAVVGTTPQDLKFGGEITTLEIGKGTVVREYVTLNRGTNESKKTVIGENCFIMAYAHVAHDCRIGNNVIIANAVQMGGHVEIEDWTIVGGLVPIHQFTKIGGHVMIGGGFRVVKDLPPYILAGGTPLKYEGVNVVGLRRRGFTNDQIHYIKEAYDQIYNSQYNVSDAAKLIKETFEQTPQINNILNFVARSSRGIVRG